MQRNYSSIAFKLVRLVFATALCLGITGIQAAQFQFTDPVNSAGNNFTMLDAGNGPIGGTNDVIFTWDGTLNDAVTGAVSNATMTSDEAFFGNLWDAHDVTLYGPGTYTIYDGCSPGDAGCGTGNAVTFTVGADQIGAHILFDWPQGSTGPDNTNIDVVLIWNFNENWATENGALGSPFYAGLDNGSGCNAPSGGTCVTDGLPNTDQTTFSLMSTDWSNDGITGAPMTDGAFAGSYANFNLNGVTFPAAVNSTGNNFTMLDAGNGPIGGTNDVVFTWDETLNDSVATAVTNATLASDEAFFGNLWDAHDVMLYGEGTYTIYDGCPAGDPGCGIGNAVTFTVGNKQIGAHILFDWPEGSTGPDNTNIDVVLVWNFNKNWATQNGSTGSPFFTGLDNGSGCTPPTGGTCVVDGLPNTDQTVFSLVSTDWNGDGIVGAPMTDGAFAGSYANFNLSGVTFPNLPPTANDLGRSTLVDTPVIIDVAAYTSDSDGVVDPASVAIGTNPSNGTLANNGDGTVTYTPNSGFVSPPTDSFQYTIDDDFGDTSNAATVTVTVTSTPNPVPVANDAALTTDEDITLDIPVDSVASTTGSGALVFENFDATTAEGGTVTVDATNTILTYTPLADFSGTDSFTYWVTDNIDSSNVAMVTVTVNPVNDPLVCTDVALGTGSDEPLAISVADDLLSTCTDPEGDTITLASITQPTQTGSMVTDDGAGTLTYTPAPDFNGQDSFTYTATDGTDTDTRTVTIDVGKIFGNFTMLDGGGTTFGGTNDIVFTWDGTCYNSVAEADAGPENMTMGSDSSFPFFGFPWFAHDIKVYCPGGPYTVDTCNDASVPADKCGPLTFTVPPDHLGGHILFDWNVTADIDVAIVWNNSTGGTWENVVSAGPLYQGPTGPTPALDEFYDWISIDADGDGIPGIQFVDGPFIDFRANFNFKTTAGGGGDVDIPRSTISSPNLGSTCTIGSNSARLVSHSDWVVLAGFIAGLGFVGYRRRKKLH